MAVRGASAGGAGDTTDATPQPLAGVKSGLLIAAPPDRGRTARPRQPLRAVGARWPSDRGLGLSAGLERCCDGLELDEG